MWKIITIFSQLTRSTSTNRIINKKTRLNKRNLSTTLTKDGTTVYASSFFSPRVSGTTAFSFQPTFASREFTSSGIGIKPTTRAISTRSPWLFRSPPSGGPGGIPARCVAISLPATLWSPRPSGFQLPWHINK